MKMDAGVLDDSEYEDICSDEIIILEWIVIHKIFYSTHLSLEKKRVVATDRGMMNEPGFRTYYDLEAKHIEKNRRS